MLNGGRFRVLSEGFVFLQIISEIRKLRLFVNSVKSVSPYW